MQTLRYRPSIDGLRAVAVVAVLLFHLNKNWLPGGFLGVDVFFALSGYLITSIIFIECRQQTFSLGKFYQRRISRIFPALFTVLLTTIFAASLVYSSQDFASAGINLSAAILSIANFKFMMQGSYFTLSPDAQPFLHTWSLSVEEQFYIFFPIFLFVLYKYFGQRRIVLASVIGGMVISFAACIYLTTVNQTWAFFLLPTRAWELLAGCSLAIIAESNNVTITSKISSMFSNIGIILIVASLFLIKESRSFPSFWPLFPVLGTLLILGINKGTNSITERILSVTPFVFLGKISYSLYLWHWPVFSFVDYSLYQSDNLTRMALKLLITSAAAISCYFIIEQPARNFLNVPKRQITGFAAFGALALIFATSGLWIRNNYYLNASINSAKAGGITINTGSTAGSIVLIGDSNGSMYGKSVKEIANELGFKLNILTVAAGDPLPDTELWRNSLSTIEKVKPDFLIFAASWSSKLKDNEARLTTALSELDKYCDWIILITQPPVLPESASREKIRQNGLTSFTEESSTRLERNKFNQMIKDVQSKNVIVIDVESLFAESTGEIKFVNNKGQQLYQDAGHLSEYGSDLVQDILLKTIRAQVERSSEFNFRKNR